MKRILFAMILAMTSVAGSASGQTYMPGYVGPMREPAVGLVTPVAYMQPSGSDAGCVGMGCADGGCAVGCDGSGSGSPCGDCGPLCGDCGTICGGACGGRLGGRGGCGTGLFSGGGLFGAGGLFGPGTCRPSRIWFDGEYLLWWNKERTLPPLVTTSPDNTLIQDAGVLGVPGTAILFGNSQIGEDSDQGYRYGGGLWLNRDQTFGVGARYYRLDEEAINFAIASSGSPILARPFFDTQTNDQTSLLVAYPSLYSGSVGATAANELSGGDLYLRVLLLSGYGNRLDLIGGYDYSNIDDRIHVNHSVLFNDPQGRFPIGTTLVSSDRFDVENSFRGGSVGFMSESEDGCVTWRLLAKIAFGNMNQNVRIRGTTTTTAPNNGGVAVNDTEGLLALPTNIGNYEQDQFAVMPEAGVSAGIKLTKQLQLTVGYSFLYWSRVQLAQDAIDTTINTSQFAGNVSGTPRPQFSFDDTSFWVQGLNFGLNLRY